MTVYVGDLLIWWAFNMNCLSVQQIIAWFNTDLITNWFLWSYQLYYYMIWNILNEIWNILNSIFNLLIQPPPPFPFLVQKVVPRPELEVLHGFLASLFIFDCGWNQFKMVPVIVSEFSHSPSLPSEVASDALYKTSWQICWIQFG